MKKHNLPLILSSLILCIFLFFVLETFTFQPNKSTITSEDFFNRHPWLKNRSTWFQFVDTSKMPYNTSKLGCFPIGNGYVFTTLGLEYPLNTLKNTIGPTYQKQVGFLGGESIKVKIKGKEIDLPEQWVWKVRRTDILITKATNDQLELYTIDFAPPALKAIIRIIILKNIGTHTIKDSQIICEFKDIIAKPSKKKLILTRGPVQVCAGVTNAKNWPENTNLIIPAPNLKPQTQMVILHYLMITKNKPAELKIIQQANFQLLQDTKNWWDKWMEATTSIECPDQKIADLLDDMKVMLKAQQALPNGAFSPMFGYTYCWIRDSNGPTLYLLRTGKFKEVKQALDFYYLGSIATRSVPNCLPLDLNFKDLPMPTQIDWSKIPVQPAESASFIILQHYWYYKYTGDLTTIKTHYQYLKRNIYGQKISKDFKLPFHGDETYLWPGYEFTRLTHKPPPDYITSEFYSADSSFEFVAATEALAEMAINLGKTSDAKALKSLADKARQATEQFYWLKAKGYYAPAIAKTTPQKHQLPFANINLCPLWISYLKPENEKATQNLLNTLKLLHRPDDSLKTTPRFAYWVGMLPGMLLYNLAVIDHPQAEQALKWLLKSASPLADYAEFYTPNHKPATKIWGKNRIRPWEGGINADALLFYLTGFQPQAHQNKLKLTPHLPNNWKYLKIKNCRIGNNFLDIEINDTNQKRNYIILNKGNQKLKIQLSISLPLSTIKSLTINNKTKPIPTISTKFSRTKFTTPFLSLPKTKTTIKVVYQKRKAM